MTKHSSHRRWKGHCYLCGRLLGNSSRKWQGSPAPRRRLLGRTRRMSRARIVSIAREESS